MHVRRAGPDDFDAAAATFAAVADEGRWILTEGPVDVAEWSLRMQANPDPMWVLEGEGRIVGLLALHAVPRAPDVMSLGMNVLAEARGRGGGRMLLEAALEHARSAGLHKLELEVFPENARAVGLYAGCGFAVEGLRREVYLRRDGSRRDALLMGLILG
jgi:putative acetyltransferase